MFDQTTSLPPQLLGSSGVRAAVVRVLQDRWRSVLRSQTDLTPDLKT